MRSPATGFAPLRYSTSNLPERARLPFWRGFFARKVVPCDIEAQSDLPFHAEATLLEWWPGLRAIWAETYTPQRLQWTPEMAAGGDDSFALLIKKRGLMVVSRLGGDFPLRVGDAIGPLHAEPARMTTLQADYIGLIVPRAALVPLMGDVKRVAMRLIPRDNGALRLLMKYLEIVRDNAALMTPELRHCGVSHIHDLIAMALGATRDGATIANGRGVRAGRLKMIKADILENLGDPGLTVTAVALRQHVTPRYIHMLFETERITFSEFVLDQRLMRTHRMLFEPRFAGLNVSAIAFAAGFGDLSYFNRTFRRRFGAAPSELRHSFPGTDHRLAPGGSSVRV
jgi:AraC-like DNA-binding protein